MPRDPDPRATVARSTLGSAIRRRRELLEMSLADLSISTGLSPFTIRAIEQGRRGPSIEALLAIAAALGLSVRGLLDGVYPWDDVPPPEEA